MKSSVKLKNTSPKCKWNKSRGYRKETHAHTYFKKFLEIYNIKHIVKNIWSPYTSFLILSAELVSEVITLAGRYCFDYV